MKRVLFIDRVHPEMMRALTDKGFQCEEDYDSPYEALRDKIADYVGVVIRSRVPMDASMIGAADRLRFIARSGSGLENIDLEAANTAGVAVYNSPEGNRDAVAEHAIGMVLSLFNKLCAANLEVRRGVWLREENRGLELSGRTVGIIGFGHMGGALAKRLSGFGCNIFAYDKYKSDYAPDYVTEVGLEEIQARCDVISLHIPLSEETHHFVDDRFIESCAKPFYLINTARGVHVSTPALVRGLSSGRVAGACLDVLEYEKRSFERLSFSELPDDFRALIELDNVMLSPHVAGWTVESYLKLALRLAEKIKS